MAVKWLAEACDERSDPLSGAPITRLTSAVAINNNIYCEQPYSSPDGRRIAFTRITGTPGFDGVGQIFVADLDRIRITPIVGVKSGNNGYWGEWFYYLDEGGNVMAFSLDTLGRRAILSHPDKPDALATIAPDGRYSLGRAILPGPTVGIVRLDLESGESKVIYEHPEIVNPHLQFNPVHGRDILVQHNRGAQMAADGTITGYTAAEGCTLFMLDREGENFRQLPAGRPWTESCTGHECFVADTGRVAFTSHWNWKTGELTGPQQEGNLFTAAPGDEEPTLFIAPEHRFNHLCVSRCGVYFVADSLEHGLEGDKPLVIGNLLTGKYRTIVSHSEASGGGAQYTHPHPYLTGDNGHVIYNADPRGIPHVYKARIPDGFLASLD